MKLFITGGTGFIGSSLVPKLVAKGHQVVGLARTDEAAAKLKSWGAESLRGDLTDLDVLVEGAKESDGVLHLAFIFNSDDFSIGVGIDRRAIEAMGNALVGTNKIFIGTSGTLTYIFAGVDVATEDTPVKLEGPPILKRAENELFLLTYAEKGVRTSVVRLSPTVHKGTTAGLMSIIAEVFKGIGAVYYADKGDNVWPSGQVDDSADLFVLAVEAGLSNQVYHATDEDSVRIKDMAEAIAKKAGLEAHSVSKDELSAKIGPFFGMVFASDNKVSSKKTRELTGWSPSGIGLIEDYSA